MLGHKCSGGGATIKDSPINIHIHIHTGEPNVTQKITRAISNLFGTRQDTINLPTGVSENDIQGSVIRKLED